MKLDKTALWTWDEATAELHARAAALSKRPYRSACAGSDPPPRGRVLSSATPAQRLAELAERQSRMIVAGTLRFVPHPELDAWHHAHAVPVGVGSAAWLARPKAERNPRIRRPARRPSTIRGGTRMSTITTATLTPKARRKPAAAKATPKAGAPAPTPRTPAKGSTMAAVLKVLDKSSTPMHYSDIVAKILRYNMAPGLNGATPRDTIKAQLYMAAKTGRHGITQTSAGTFGLKTSANGK